MADQGRGPGESASSDKDLTDEGHRPYDQGSHDRIKDSKGQDSMLAFEDDTPRASTTVDALSSRPPSASAGARESAHRRNVSAASVRSLIQSLTRTAPATTPTASDVHIPLVCVKNFVC